MDNLEAVMEIVKIAVTQNKDFYTDKRQADDLVDFIKALKAGLDEINTLSQK